MNQSKSILWGFTRQIYGVYEDASGINGSSFTLKIHTELTLNSEKYAVSSILWGYGCELVFCDEIREISNFSLANLRFRSLITKSDVCERLDLHTFYQIELSLKLILQNTKRIDFNQFLNNQDVKFCFYIVGTCQLDKLEVQSELDICMEKLHDFLSDWLTSVRKGGRTPFDTCG